MAYEKKSTLEKLLSKRPMPCKSLYIMAGWVVVNPCWWTCFTMPVPSTKSAAFISVHSCWKSIRLPTNVDKKTFLMPCRYWRNIFVTMCVCCVWTSFMWPILPMLMLIGRLFGKLFDLGVTVVITSNRHPNDLYQGGLLKEQFLFFIKVLEKAANIVAAKSRGGFSPAPATNSKISYCYPLDAYANAFIQHHFDILTHCAPRRPWYWKCGRTELP